MTGISFKQKSATSLDDSYFNNLEDVSRHLFSVLQMNRDEAGTLDKKLSPDLIALSARALESLKQQETRIEAERFLQSDLLTLYSIPDVLVAVLRQNFRVDNERLARWLKDYLAELVSRDETGTGRKAVLEAAGSEIRTLAMLADEVSLRIADIADLARLAQDPFCSTGVRIKAARRLCAAQNVHGIDVALQLINEHNTNPNFKQHLMELIKEFGTFREINVTDLENHLILPVLTMLKQNDPSQTERKALLERVIDQLPKAFLVILQEINVERLDPNNWFYAPVALGRCAQHETDATELLLEWADSEGSPDSFRAECCVRLANPRTVHTSNFSNAVANLRQSLQRNLYKERAKVKAIETLDRIINQDHNSEKSVSIQTAYADLYRFWQDEEEIDSERSWSVLNMRSAQNFIQERIQQGDQDELDFLVALLTSDRVRGVQPARLAALIRHLLNALLYKSNEVYAVMFSAASKLADQDPVRQDVINFLVERIKAQERDASIAKQYWQKLAKHG